VLKVLIQSLLYHACSITATIFAFSRVFFLGAGKSYDIMSLKEEQVASKQTFVFLGSLANEYPAKQDVKCDSTNS